MTVEKRRRAVRTVLWGLVPVAVAGAAVAALPHPIVLYNPSPSVPTGYYVRTGGAPAKGRLIAFHVPPLGRDYASAHVPYLVRGSILKPIAASGGDTVCTTGPKGLTINGNPIAPIAERDRRGVRLPHWRDCRRLRRDEYFVVSTRIPNSFDSRYYGPVTSAEIIGTFRPLSTDENS
jgi:conjugative transfer signal peptidase TraF